jgi:hypothetical protein
VYFEGDEVRKSAREEEGGRRSGSDSMERRGSFHLSVTELVGDSTSCSVGLRRGKYARRRRFSGFSFFSPSLSSASAVKLLYKTTLEN